MAEEEEDELFDDLMNSMTEAGVDAAEEEKPAESSTAETAPNIPTDELEEEDEEFKNRFSFFKKYFSKEYLKNLVKKFKARAEGNWQLPFMLISFTGAIFVWSFLPDTINEEDKVQSPEWWFERALVYYDIAEDLGLKLPNQNFSRYEFLDGDFENQIKLLDDLKNIKSFNSRPSRKNHTKFSTTLSNDLNKLILDENLIKRIPDLYLDEIDSSELEKIKESIKNSKWSSIKSTRSKNNKYLKRLNRQVLELAFEDLPKFKSSRLLAAKYFKFVYDINPRIFNKFKALEVLNAADTFYYVASDKLPQKAKLNVYEIVEDLSDNSIDAHEGLFKGGNGEIRSKPIMQNFKGISPEDITHLYYMIAKLNNELGNNVKAQKFYKKFLELAIERTSDGYERRLEKSVGIEYDISRVALHRRTTPQKINFAYFNLGILQFKNSEFELSKSNFTKFINQEMLGDSKKDFLANKYLGNIFLDRKNYDKALGHYLKALNINAITDNQKSAVVYKTGLAHFKLGNFKKAINRFSMVRGTGIYDEFNSPALFYLGKSYINIKQDEKAIEIFKRIHDQFPSSKEDIAGTFEISKYNFRKKKYDISFSETIVEADGSKSQKNNFSIKFLLEKLARKNGALISELPLNLFLENEFLNVSEILTQPDSNSTEIGLLYDLANVFTARKDYEKAIEVYTLMTTNPLAIHQMGKKRDKLYFDMAKIWIDNDLPIRAGETLELMIEKIPETPFYSQALWDVCKYYMIKNDYSRAIKPLRQFTSTYFKRPESPEAHYLLGICEQKVGDYGEAIKNFNLAYGYIVWKPAKIRDEETGKLKIKKGASDPYFRLNRRELPIDRNLYAYKAIYQKGAAMKEAGYYDLAIGHVYRTVFNDPLFRFRPESEVWRKSVLIYADSHFHKGWKSKNEKKRQRNYKIAKEKYVDYLERYEFELVKGVGGLFEKEQMINWEIFDVESFDIYYNMAHMYYDQNNYDKARELYSKLVKWDVNKWSSHVRKNEKKDAYIMIPLTYFNQKNWKKAIIAYREAKDRYSTSAEAPGLGMRIGECLLNLGQDEKAQEEFKAAKWVLDAVNKNLYVNKSGDVNKQYWDDLIKFKKNNLIWNSKNIKKVQQ
ncbi:MAG: hypothetical protein COA79_01035 [Planctomycetota bacterium]|nr:MAG: hypothetical protein COA79_01035 [Planctomycetota bacterium]